MEFNRRMRHALVGAAALDHTPTPGKRTLTEGVTAQRSRVERDGDSEVADTDADRRSPEHGPADVQMLFGVPRAAAAEDPAHVHAAAARGTLSTWAVLPSAPS